jgi:hypothetical protein
MGRKAVVDLWCSLTSRGREMRRLLIKAAADEATKGPSQERVVATSTAEETRRADCNAKEGL